MNLKIIFLLLMMGIAPAYARQGLTMEESIQRALKNNLQVKADEYTIQSYQQLKKTQTDLGKTNLSWMNGQYNSLNKDNNFTISQTIPFPTVIAQQLKLGDAHIEESRLNLSVTRNELVYQVSTVYLQLSYLKSLQKLLLSQDSLYSGFVTASDLRFKTGETNLLEKTTAETQMLDIKNQLTQNEAEIAIYKTQLQTLLNTSEVPEISEPLHKLVIETEDSSVNRNPHLLLSRQQVIINRQTKKVEQGRFLPDITVAYFNQSLTGFQQIGNDEVYFDRTKRFTGFQLGIAVPLWFVPQAGKARSARYAEAASQKKYEYMQASVKNNLSQAQQELRKNEINLRYYENSALKNASLILRQSQKAFASGEIGYLEYLLAVRNAHTIRTNYLSALNQYDQSILRIHYLKGEN